MLAYYVEWHTRERLAPLLFMDEAKAEGAVDPVGLAQRSETGQRKDRTRQTLADGQPLHSFEDLLENLAGLTVAELELEVAPKQRPAMVSALTPLQEQESKLPRSSRIRSADGTADRWRGGNLVTRAISLLGRIVVGSLVGDVCDRDPSDSAQGTYHFAMALANAREPLDLATEIRLGRLNHRRYFIPDPT